MLPKNGEIPEYGSKYAHLNTTTRHHPLHDTIALISFSARCSRDGRLVFLHRCSVSSRGWGERYCIHFQSYKRASSQLIFLRTTALHWPTYWYQRTFCTFSLTMFKVAFFLTVFAALAASAPTTEPAGELSKRCFHNGGKLSVLKFKLDAHLFIGGWYWCALDVPKEDASAPATEIASREPHQNEKRCFHNGGKFISYELFISATDLEYIRRMVLVRFRCSKWSSLYSTCQSPWDGQSCHSWAREQRKEVFP